MDIEVDDVVCDKIGVLVREDTVEDKFDDIKRCSIGSHFACKFDVIAVNLNESDIGIFISGRKMHMTLEYMIYF